MPTYSGGSGVFADDTMGATADLQARMVVGTLLRRKGCFFQQFYPTGWQLREIVRRSVGGFLMELTQAG